MTWVKHETYLYYWADFKVETSFEEVNNIKSSDYLHLSSIDNSVLRFTVALPYQVCLETEQDCSEFLPDQRWVTPVWERKENDIGATEEPKSVFGSYAECY